MRAEERVRLANYMLGVLFKLITGNYEELRLPAMRAFLGLFRKLKRINENGALIRGALQYEKNDYSFLLTQFAAQVDSVISQTLKNEEKNHPDINFLAYELAYKHFKIMLR
jgi:hypothetical protein